MNKDSGKPRDGRTKDATGQLAPLAVPTKFEFETFSAFDSYRQSQLEHAEPSIWNGRISIRKWRITAEQIDEPIEILRDRLRELWRKETNHHHWWLLQTEAARLGIKLSDKERGSSMTYKKQS